MSSSASYLATIKEELDRLRDEQGRIFDMFEELTSFQVRLASFASLSSETEIYERLLDVLASTISFSFAKVLRSTVGHDSFRVEHSVGLDALPAEVEVPEPDRNLLEWAIQKEQVSIYPVEDLALKDHVASMIVIPLVGRREAMGATVLWTQIQPEELSQHMFQMLSIFSSEVAGVMENLDLYLRSQKLAYLLDNTIESVPHAILVLGLDDRIISCNKNAEFLFGFKRFFALEERYQDVLPKEMAHTFSGLILTTLEGRVEIDQEIDYAIDARTRLTLGISSSLLSDRHGKPQGVLFICRDMSLSREVEKLREVDRMKTEFVNTVSHELKTPLTAILSGVELLRSEDATFDEGQRELLSIVEEASNRLQSLLEDILDLSKLEDGEGAIDKDWTSLEELVSATATMLLGASPNHELNLQIEPETPELCVDRLKITQVLENLISNAIKYSPEGGSVDVRLFCEGDQVKVSVIDHGFGIPPKEVEKIWNKFFRAAGAQDRQIEGTGLGLAIAKHIMELHEGDILVESEEKVGSTFTLTLPRKEDFFSR